MTIITQSGNLYAIPLYETGSVQKFSEKNTKEKLKDSSRAARYGEQEVGP